MTQDMESWLEAKIQAQAAELAELKTKLVNAGVLKSGPDCYLFNLEAALAGARLVTRDGREVSGFRKRVDGALYTGYPYQAIVCGDVETFTETGAFSVHRMGSTLDLFLAEPWPRQEATPEPKLGDGWPWVPKIDEWCHSAMSGGSFDRYTWRADGRDQARAERFNVYRTQAEAVARAELDKRLAIHAALRQLGGGDEGAWCLRYDHEAAKWKAVYRSYSAPGEARFTTEAAAQAALDVLLDRGILKHGEAL